jgi:hypothetical protein
MDAERLPKSLRRYAARIDDYSVEESGIFISYKSGWKSCTDPLGVVHGDVVDTVKDAVWHVRSADLCDCVDCQPKEMNERKEP